SCDHPFPVDTVSWYAALSYRRGIDMKAFVLAAVVCLTTSLVAGCRSSEGGGDGAAGSGGSSGSGGSGGSGGTGGSSGTTVKQLRMKPPGIGPPGSVSNVVGGGGGEANH